MGQVMLKFIAATELKTKGDQKNLLIIAGKMTKSCSGNKLLIAMCKTKIYSSSAVLIPKKNVEKNCKNVFYGAKKTLTGARRRVKLPDCADNKITRV